MSKGLKFFLIFLIVVVFGAIGYFVLSGQEMPEISLGNTNSTPLQSSTGAPVSGLAAQTTPDIDADQIGQEFLTQLLNIRSIKLRDDIFSRPSFVSLTDFTIELIQLGNEGRINPFAPFGIDGDTAPSDINLIPADLLPTQIDSIPFSGEGSVTPVAPQPAPENISVPPNINNS